MSLEELEKELYGQKPRVKRRVSKPQQPKQKKPAVTENPWQKVREKQAETPRSEADVVVKTVQSYSKVLLIGLVIILVGLLGVAGYYLYEFFTTRDVRIAVSMPSEAFIGEEILVAVTFENTSTKTLIDPRVSLTLPSGAIAVKDTQQRVIEAKIKDIGPGESIREEFNVVLVGDPLQTYQFGGGVSYGYEGSALASRFEKKTTGAILGREPVVVMDLSAPESILNGQDFEIHTTYQNISGNDLDEVRFIFEVPETFTLNNSEPKLENNIFTANNLSVGQERIAIFSGSVVGQDYSFFTIKGIAQIQIGGEWYDINTKSHTVSITPSPLSMKIFLESSDQTLSPGQRLNYRVEYMNNAQDTLEDVVLEAKLIGDMFLMSSVESNGFFNSQTRAITWTASNIPQLQELGVRESGSANFSVSLRPDYPAFQLADKDFVVIVRGQISSPTLPPGVIAQETAGITEIQNKVKGNLTLSQFTYFQEPSGSIVNQGSLPPQVGVPIEYTVHWNLSAVGTDFENISINAFLGPGVEWTGKLTSNITQVPTYNSRTQQVAWQIERIQAGSGTLTSGPQVIFQVRIIPSQVQSGEKITLVTRGNVSGTDVFVERPVILTLPLVESDDLSDGILPEKFDTVQ